VTARIVVVGASLGGLDALRTVLSGLAKPFPLPIAIVQHRGKENPGLLAKMLQKNTALIVTDAEHGDILTAATVYVAPADYHLMVESDRCALSLEAPVQHARPAIDVLFESAADAYGADVIAVVLTGNNSDGAYGACRVKAAGGMVLVQDPDDCEAPMMPRTTMTAVEVDHVLKLEQISPFLMKHCRPEENRYERR